MTGQKSPPPITAFVWKALWAALAVIASLIGYNIRDTQQRQAEIEKAVSDHNARIQVNRSEIEHLKKRED